MWPIVPASADDPLDAIDWYALPENDTTLASVKLSVSLAASPPATCEIVSTPAEKLPARVAVELSVHVSPNVTVSPPLNAYPHPPPPPPHPLPAPPPPSPPH